MTVLEQRQEDLETTIAKAKEKLGIRSNAELSRYLPGQEGFALHHNTFIRYQKVRREKLQELIDNAVLKIENAQKLPSALSRRSQKPTKAKAREFFLNSNQLKDLIEHLQASGKHELAATILPQVASFSEVSRLLKASISRKEVNHDLWKAYVERHRDEYGESS